RTRIPWWPTPTPPCTPPSNPARTAFAGNPCPLRRLTGRLRRYGRSRPGRATLHHHGSLAAILDPHSAGPVRAAPDRAARGVPRQPGVGHAAPDGIGAGRLRLRADRPRHV